MPLDYGLCNIIEVCNQGWGKDEAGMKTQAPKKNSLPQHVEEHAENMNGNVHIGNGIGIE